MVDCSIGRGGNSEGAVYAAGSKASVGRVVEEERYPNEVPFDTGTPSASLHTILAKGRSALRNSFLVQCAWDASESSPTRWRLRSVSSDSSRSNRQSSSSWPKCPSRYSDNNCWISDSLMNKFPKVRISETALQGKFNRNEGGYPSKISTLRTRRLYDKPAHPSSKQVPGTRSIVDAYYDGSQLVMVLHHFLKPDGTLGASGKLDPKQLLVNDTMYVK